MEEKKFFINIYKDDGGRFISTEDYDSYESAFESRDIIRTYVETVEVIRFKKTIKNKIYNQSCRK